MIKVLKNLLSIPGAVGAFAINKYTKRLNRKLEQAKKEYWREHYHNTFGTPENYARTMNKITGENKDGLL